MRRAADGMSRMRNADATGVALNPVGLFSRSFTSYTLILPFTARIMGASLAARSPASAGEDSCPEDR